jgi:hypothetical protein
LEDTIFERFGGSTYQSVEYLLLGFVEIGLGRSAAYTEYAEYKVPVPAV